MCECAAVVLAVGMVCNELFEDRCNVKRGLCSRAVTLCGMDASTLCGMDASLKKGIGGMAEAVTCGDGGKGRVGDNA